PEFFKTGTDYTASRLDLAVNQQAHCHCGGVPAARGQPMEDRPARRLLIEVERLRIELGRECLSPFFVDADLAGAKGLSDGEVLEIALGHLGQLPLVFVPSGGERHPSLWHRNHRLWSWRWSNDLSDLGFQLVDQDALVFRIVNRRDNQVNPTCFECCIEDGY